MTYQVLAGDCLEHMKGMADNSISSCVTDPPYGLGTQKRFGPGQKATKGPPQYARQTSGFMNLDWDRTGIAFSVDLWAEVYRILKPGAYLLAFGGAQTFHRMAVAIEDAGFDIKPNLAWIYATGFPHGVNVALQFEQRLCDRVEVEPDKFEWLYKDDQAVMVRQSPFRHPLANEWEGWNSSLKPAFEPIIVGRKALIGSNTENIEVWGTGCFNVDGCRIETNEQFHTPQSNPSHRQGTVGVDMGITRSSMESMHQAQSDSIQRLTSMGRYPSNVFLDDEVAADLDRQSGVSKSSAVKRNRSFREDETQWRIGGARFNDTSEYDDKGGASRFFFVAKPTRVEKDRGLQDFANSVLNRTNPGGLENDPRWAPKSVKNSHPTTKPVALMRQLVKLVTPPSGVVLDCFLGSGTTGVAAIEEGFDFIGIEKEESYVPIATTRIAHAAKIATEKEHIKTPSVTVKGTTFTQSILPGVA